MKRQTIYLFISLLFSIMSVTANAQSLKGDLNGDGLVNAGDMTSLVNKILGLAEGSSAYDLNDDGKTNITDVVCLISIIVNQQISSFLTCPDDHHPHMIDLGLPSGVKWSCCNVGATTPEAPGDYYAWGETEAKDNYSWETYIHCDGTQETCHFLGDICGTEYDVAHVKWGGQWHMPNRDQMKELFENCSYEWITLNGTKGGKFTSKTNGNSIFLPAAGFFDNSSLYSDLLSGYYWNGTPNPVLDYCIFSFPFYDNSFYGTYNWRYRGNPIRPVISETITSPLLLSSSTLNVIVGNERAVEITSGSCFYTVKSSDENVATAVSQSFSVNVTAIAVGNATITVTDTRTNQMATIDVIVIPSLTNCPDDHHPHMIDLGLPSGIKWSCCNVGSTTPEGLGGYYAWAETEEKNNYSWSTYLYCDGNQETCQFLGNITGTTYDVAHVKWGSAWRMPTGDEADELRSNCNVETITYSNLVFDKFTGPNGNSIFIPYAGSMWYASNNEIGEQLWCWTSDQHSNRSSAQYLRQTGIMGFCWLFEGLTVRPVYDPLFFFSLSEETVDVFVNGTSSVTIEMGSGKYELQCDHPEIVEAELFMADKEETPDVKDEIEIFGVAEGTATVTLVDTKTNKTATVVVNVKTPTAEDIENTKNYIYRIRNYIDLQTDLSVIPFQNNLINWLNQQPWVSQTDLNEMRNSITITMCNSVKFHVDFVDDSDHEELAAEEGSRMKRLRGTDDNEDKYFNVIYQDDESIINSPKILLIQGRTMPNFDNTEACLADIEYEEIMTEKENSPINLDVERISKSLSFLSKRDFKEYGHIFITETHGYGPPNSIGKEGWFQVEDKEKWMNENQTPMNIQEQLFSIEGLICLVNDGAVYSLGNTIYAINPKAIRGFLNNSIIYGSYCHSKGIVPNSNYAFMGYSGTTRYRDLHKYVKTYYHGIANGLTFEEATDILTGQWQIVKDNKTGKSKLIYSTPYKRITKQRYFSINATIYLSEGAPVITGKINGYQNLKTDIQYYVYVAAKSDIFWDIPSDTQPISVNSDGTFCYEYSSFSGNPDEYRFFVGFEYNGSYYYGEAKDLCPDGNHPHAIDLGLPSGTQWACCNVDPNPANQRPTNYGGHYAWGENEVKEMYHWESYIHCDGTEETIRDIGSNICATQYDVAFMKWNLYNLVSFWQMPSIGQIEELFKHCDYRRTKVNNTTGALFKSKINGNVIFLPAAGVGYCNLIQDPEILGFYWSGNIASKYRERACFFAITENDISIPFTDMGTNRYLGCSVRPVVVNSW